MEEGEGEGQRDRGRYGDTEIQRYKRGDEMSPGSWGVSGMDVCGFTTYVCTLLYCECMYFTPYVDIHCRMAFCMARMMR